MHLNKPPKYGAVRSSCRRPASRSDVENGLDKARRQQKSNFEEVKLQRYLVLCVTAGKEHYYGKNSYADENQIDLQPSPEYRDGAEMGGRAQR